MNDKAQNNNNENAGFDLAQWGEDNLLWMQEKLKWTEEQLGRFDNWVVGLIEDAETVIVQHPDVQKWWEELPEVKRTALTKDFDGVLKIGLEVPGLKNTIHTVLHDSQKAMEGIEGELAQRLAGKGVQGFAKGFGSGMEPLKEAFKNLFQGEAFKNLFQGNGSLGDKLKNFSTLFGDKLKNLLTAFVGIFQSGASSAGDSAKDEIENVVTERLVELRKTLVEERNYPPELVDAMMPELIKVAEQKAYDVSGPMKLVIDVKDNYALAMKELGVDVQLAGGEDQKPAMPNISDISTTSGVQVDSDENPAMPGAAPNTPNTKDTTTVLLH